MADADFAQIDQEGAVSPEGHAATMLEKICSLPSLRIFLR